MPGLYSLITLIILISLAVSNVETALYSKCRTPNDEFGQSVPITSCKNLYDILKRVHSTGSIKDDSADVIHLRDSFRGNHDGVHLVCCTSDQVELNPKAVDILMNQNCGAFSIPRIAYGQEADLFVFPWMALLKYKENRFLCGGSLISDRYVLTAAHCVTYPDNPVIEVRLGEHTISKEQDCVEKGRMWVCSPPVEDIGVEKIMLPPERKEWLHHDIALIRLNRSVEFSPTKRHIKPICLPLTPVLRKLELPNYIISGWGRTEKGNGSADVLQWAFVPHRNLDECEHNLGLKDLIQAEICAGGEDLRDTCNGDSGGPLSQTAIYFNQSRLVQFGVVAGGRPECGQSISPAIYTSVSYHLPWIMDNIED